MAESQDKYARELEQNRHSEEQAREQRFKFEDAALQNSKLAQQLEEKALSNTVLLNRLEKQKAVIEERDLLIEDLRQSVALKISVADDLQSILKQSQEQYQDMRRENREMAGEREMLVSKFWHAENLSQQLHEMNRQLFAEIDNMQVSVLKLSQKDATSYAALNPFLSHFSQLREQYD